MMHSVVVHPSEAPDHHIHRSDSSDESTEDLFSPVYGRMQSLHNFDTPDTPDGAERLPRLADNSWIGAQVSPIPSMQDDDYDDDDEEDNKELDRVTAPYRRTLRDFGANERSALLVGKGNNSSRIHPMWDDDFFEDAKRVANSVGSNRRPPIWGKTVVGASSLHFFCIGLHDFYLWYLQIRRGIDQSQFSQAWSIPWLGPSARVLLRFGAYCPGKIVWQHHWYRVLTAVTLTSSVTELVGVAAAWWQLERISYSTISSSKLRIWWPLLFLSSIGVGQLWMAAFGSYYSISGCAGWGTCAVLCATGVSRPDQRMPLFLTAIALVLINLLQTGSNVFGAVGASFFGWSLAGTGLSPFSVRKVKQSVAMADRWTPLNWLALITAVQLWALPILSMIFWQSREEPPTFDANYPNVTQ
jgi:hypothetical protein